MDKRVRQRRLHIEMACSGTQHGEYKETERVPLRSGREQSRVWNEKGDLERSRTAHRFVDHVNKLADINGKRSRSINELIYVMKRSPYHMGRSDLKEATPDVGRQATVVRGYIIIYSCVPKAAQTWLKIINSYDITDSMPQGTNTWVSCPRSHMWQTRCQSYSHLKAPLKGDPLPSPLT